MNFPRIALAGHRIIGNLVRRRVRSPIRAWFLSRSGIPVIGITGTNGKTTVTRLLDGVLREAGYRVGMCCTDGVLRHGEWVETGDYAGPGGVWIAAENGDVDVIVAETARGGIVKYGFGYRTCQVGVVTNVSDDHLGLDGVHTVDQMAGVKAKLVKRVDPGGTAVLNADDPRVAAMAARARGSVIYYSMHRPPAEIPRCLYAHEGFVWRRDGGKDERLMAAGDVAITRGGLLHYNLANAMAILGALDGIRRRLPVSDELATEYLKTAGTRPTERPYSFHLLEYRGDHIVVSHSKNPAGYGVDMPCLSKLRDALGYETMVGIMTHVGNRLPSFHREIAAASAQACDYLMAVPPQDEYLRGRSEAAIVEALEAGIPADKRLPSMHGDCAEIIAHLRPHYPGKTLYVLLDAGQLRGAAEILHAGRELPYEIS